MRFTILYVEAIPTPGMFTARVSYVPSGCFTSHTVRLSKYSKMGPPAYRPDPRRLESLTVYRCHSSLHLFEAPEYWSGWELNPGLTAPKSGTQPCELTSRRSWMLTIRSQGFSRCHCCVLSCLVIRMSRLFPNLNRHLFKNQLQNKSKFTSHPGSMIPKHEYDVIYHNP